jgi:hypothetical protein
MDVCDASERRAKSRARMCLPRSLPTSSPRRRGQCGARAAQRARTTLTPTSGDAPSATRKAPGGSAHCTPAHPCSAELPGPLEARRKTGTNDRPAAPARNAYLRGRTPAQTRAVTHIHAGRPPFLFPRRRFPPSPGRWLTSAQRTASSTLGWLPGTPLLAGYRDGGQSTKYDRTCLISVRSFRHYGRPTSPRLTRTG